MGGWIGGVLRLDEAGADFVLATGAAPSEIADPARQEAELVEARNAVQSFLWKAKNRYGT